MSHFAELPFLCIRWRVNDYWSDRFLPESTRWLISKRRYPEARALILQAAEMNNKTIPLYLIDERHMLIQVIILLPSFSVLSAVNFQWAFDGADPISKYRDHRQRLQVEDLVQAHSHLIRSLVIAADRSINYFYHNYVIISIQDGNNDGILWNNLLHNELLWRFLLELRSLDVIWIRVNPPMMNNIFVCVCL